MLQPVLRHLKVMEISGLGPEGAQAQQELGMYLEGLDAQAARFDERRAALLARRAASQAAKGAERSRRRRDEAAEIPVTLAGLYG